MFLSHIYELIELKEGGYLLFLWGFCFNIMEACSFKAYLDSEDDLDNKLIEFQDAIVEQQEQYKRFRNNSFGFGFGIGNGFIGSSFTGLTGLKKRSKSRNRQIGFFKW